MTFLTKCNPDTRCEKIPKKLRCSVIEPGYRKLISYSNLLDYFPSALVSHRTVPTHNPLYEFVDGAMFGVINCVTSDIHLMNFCPFKYFYKKCTPIGMYEEYCMSRCTIITLNPKGYPKIFSVCRKDPYDFLD